MLFLLILITCVLLLFLVDYVVRKYSRFWQLMNKIPGPNGLPILGSIMEIIQPPVALFYKSREWNSRFKDIYKFTDAFFGIIVISKPDDIEIILSNMKHIKKDELVYHLFWSWLGRGLLLSTGPKWVQRRKMLTPAFHFNILKDACNIFQEQALEFTNSMESLVGEEIEISQHLGKYTLQSILESSMGQKTQPSSREKINNYKRNVHKMSEYFIYRIVRLWLMSDFLFGLCKVGREQKKTIEQLHNFTKNVIDERRKAGPDYLSIMNENVPKINGKKRLAMLDLMLALEKNGEIDQSGIQEEVDTFTFEAHDTTTAALTFLLMNLANHPEVQENVVEELKGIYHTPEQEVSMDDMNKMPYMECCIKESLRLYPSVHFISRELTEEVQISNYLLPKGAPVSIHIFDVHRNPEIYPDPYKYDPERFTPENSANRHPFAYIPFSAGPRNCIGQKFAMYEIKFLVATLLRSYKILPITKPQDIIFTAGIVLRANKPVKIKLTRRNDSF